VCLVEQVQRFDRNKKKSKNVCCTGINIVSSIRMFNGKIYMYSKAVCIPMLFCTGSVEVVERCVERKKTRVNHNFAIPWQRQLHILHSCIGPEQACQFEDNLTNLRKETGADFPREE